MKSIVHMNLKNPKIARIKRLLVGLVVIMLAVQHTEADVRILPIINGGLYGGSSYFEGNRSSFKGTFKGEFIPVVRFTDKLSLMPIIKGSYTGTQTATEIIDEGTLFQQRQEYESELKLLYRFKPSWKLSVQGGGIVTRLRETTDESWKNGLYNYKTNYGGVSIEKAFSRLKVPTLLRIGFEVSTVKFPNYSTLSSQKGLNLIGEKVLDIDSSNVFIKGETSVTPRVYLEYGLTLAQDSYTDQRIIRVDGLYSDDKRVDNLSFLNSRIDYFLPKSKIGSSEWLSKDGISVKTNLSLEMKLKMRDSNQNYYDTQQLRYFPHYYNYAEVTLIPAAHLKFEPSHLIFSFGIDLTRRTYGERPAQDKAGNYLDESLFTNDVTFFTQLSYPLMRYLRIIVSADYHRATSNNDFEAFYNYTFTSSNYLIGLSYEY